MQDLANLAYMVREGGEDYSGKHFVMTNDITLNENLVNADCTDRNKGDSFQVWTPIGKYGFWSDNKFKGNFNGNSHTIYGLLIEANDYYNGLFGVVDEGTIRNLTIADSYTLKLMREDIETEYRERISNILATLAGDVEVKKK